MFRVCQEVLVNAAKHAEATKVKISFLWNEASITIKIRDFGKGFNCSDTCHGNASGLAAIKERMHQAGGDCTISSKIGEGTTVEISHPFSKD
jgi:two-component system sensor histidine kinase NreB